MNNHILTHESTTPKPAPRAPVSEVNFIGSVLTGNSRTPTNRPCASCSSTTRATRRGCCSYREGLFESRRRDGYMHNNVSLFARGLEVPSWPDISRLAQTLEGLLQVEITAEDSETRKGEMSWAMSSHVREYPGGRI